jgi:threonine dehydratase
MPDTALSTHRISLERIAQAAREIDPVFLHSPQFACEPLGLWLKCDLTLKVETLNPIRSFKGRGADYFLRQRAARLKQAPLVCASAGNFGQAMAYACRKRGLPLVVYAAVEANPHKVARMRALGAEVRLEGRDFDEAKLAAKRWAAEAGATMVEDGLVAEITEGAGTIAVELFTNGNTYDAVVVPLGNGALLNGMGRWIKYVSPDTKVIGVVSEAADAMQASWLKGPGAAPVSRSSATTIADGIAVRVPIREAVADMHGIVDEVIAVDDAVILQSMRHLHAMAGLVVEPAGAAGIAALAANAKRFEGQRIATVLCGSNLTASQMQDWLL